MAPDGPLAVVGANGWIGRRVVDLASPETTTIGLVRQPRPGSHQAAIPDAAALRRELLRIDPAAVVNCAGAQQGNDAALQAANVDVVRVLVEVATATGARLIQIGSAAEYGDQGTACPITEEAPAEPSSTYGLSKLAATRLVLQARQAGADATVLRLFNLVGPGQPPRSPVAEFADSVLRLPTGGGVVEVGNPELVRDYVSLDFAVSCVLAAIGKSPSKAVINVCSGRGITFGELVRTLGRRAGRIVDVRSRGWAGISSVVGDPTAMTAELEVRPAPDDLDRALEQVIATAPPPAPAGPLASRGG